MSRSRVAGCSLSIVIVNVTTLGSSAGASARSIGNIANYLEGSAPEMAMRLNQPGSRARELEESGPGTYYADSGAGRWIGDGAGGAGFALSGAVQRQQFERLLSGQDPKTGSQLMHAQGSSRRANDIGDEGPLTRASALERASKSALDNASADTLTLDQVAEMAGVAPTYLRRVARRTEAELVAQASALAQGLAVPELSSTHLTGIKQGRSWVFDREEVDRFLANRKAPQVVHGYDITFSVPKSVSVLWAASSPEIQATIEQALTIGVDAGMAYLQDEGFWVRRGRGEERADGMTAAAYRHHTSRALEPQLHDHVVVPNMAWGPGGRVQAVDARGLHAHATPAGHIADAAMRRHLTRTLGIEWTEVQKGSAEIVGIPRDAIRAMSTRRADLMSLADEVGAFTTEGRQKAALATRPAKDRSVNPAQLMGSWLSTLAEHGLTPDLAAHLTIEPRPKLTLSGIERDRLTDWLSSAEGVTRERAVFDRRDVVAAVADRAGTFLETSEILELADTWLADQAVPLEITNTWQTIGWKGKVALSRDQVYSTPEMIAAEQRVLERHLYGLNRGSVRVAPDIVEAAIARAELHLGHELGADQAAAVRAITTSGHRYQAVQGLAGAGKTTAMSAAVDAWHSQGFRVIGLAPFGTAARKLGQETGIDTRTVESFLTMVERSGDPARIISPSTVILIDEASTISNRQLDRLYRITESAGANLRAVGDPQQHRSVEAGGLWSALVAVHHDTTPVMDINRRQDPELLATVRTALSHYRAGRIETSLDLLDSDNRIVTEASWPQLLDRLATDWHVHHIDAIKAGRAPSQMIAERNRDRVELNTRAQTLLAADGRLGPGMDIGDTRLHVGDRVIAQQQAPELVAPGRDRHQHVLNGSTGTVLRFTGPERTPNAVIEFDGLGPIEVPHAFIEQDIGNGRGGGIAPAYAITSYKAEGQTYEAALGLAAPGAVNREGMYVALTRGRSDLQIYSIDPNASRERLEAEIPGLLDRRTTTQALRDALQRSGRPDVASIADPGIAAALGDLGSIGRGQELSEALAAAQAVARPAPPLVEVLGPRPGRPGAHQEVWDQAVASHAIYAHHYPDTLASGPAALPLPVIHRPEQTEHYRSVVDTLERARVAAIGMQPIDLVIAEREQLARINPDQQLRNLMQASTEAEQALERAIRQHDIAANSLSPQGMLRRVPQADIERVAELQTEIAKARALQASTERSHAALAPELHEQSRRQLDLDDGLTWRVERAIERPARYLTEVLGPRPSGVEAPSWDKAASAIEWNRHKLGLTPDHGPLPGPDPLARAVGIELAGYRPLVRSVELSLDPSLARGNGLEL